jgi:hypothetical protein
MQSVEYRIDEVSPVTGSSVENITSVNLNTWWESPSGSATIKISFPECVLSSLLISVSSKAKLIITARGPKTQPFVLFEGTVITNFSSQNLFQLNKKIPCTQCVFEISTVDGTGLKIYCVVFKTAREESEGMAVARPVTIPIKTANFYAGTGTSAVAKRQVVNKLGKMQQTTLNGSFLRTSPNAVLEKTPARYEDEDLAAEQKRSYEYIQNNRQKTLRSYMSMHQTPSCSYANLIADSEYRNYVVCCKDEEKVKQCLEEICEVLGICYLAEPDDGVTHLIYDGHEEAIFSFALSMKIKVVSKRWLLDCVSKREALKPEFYMREI